MMSRSYRAGLILLGVLSAADLALPVLTDGEHPPMSVALAGAVASGAAVVVLNVVGSAMVLSGSRRPTPAGMR
jgi:hypothetical protein